MTACQHQSRRREGRRPQTISLQRREPALACLSDMVPVPREYPFCSSSRRSGQASLPRLLDIFTSTTTVASRRPPLRGRILDASPSARPDTDTDVDQTTLPLSHDPGPLQPSSLLSAPGSQFLAIFSAGFARLSTATTVSSTRLFLPPLHPLVRRDQLSRDGHEAGVPLRTPTTGSSTRLRQPPHWAPTPSPLPNSSVITAPSPHPVLTQPPEAGGWCL